MPVTGVVKSNGGSRIDRRLQAARNDLGSAEKTLKDAQKAFQEAVDRRDRAVGRVAEARMRLKAVETLKESHEKVELAGSIVEA